MWNTAVRKWWLNDFFLDKGQLSPEYQQASYGNVWQVALLSHQPCDPFGSDKHSKGRKALFILQQQVQTKLLFTNYLIFKKDIYITT